MKIDEHNLSKTCCELGFFIPFKLQFLNSGPFIGSWVLIDPQVASIESSNLSFYRHCSHQLAFVTRSSTHLHCRLSGLSLSLSLSQAWIRSTSLSSLCGPICAIWIVIVCCLGLCSLGFIFLGLISLFLGLIHLGVIYLSLGLFFSFKPKNIQRIRPMSTRTKTDSDSTMVLGGQRWVGSKSSPKSIQNNPWTTLYDTVIFA